MSLSLPPLIEKEPSLILVSLKIIVGYRLGWSTARDNLPNEYTIVPLKDAAIVFKISIVGCTSEICISQINLRSLMGVPLGKPVKSVLMIPGLNPFGLLR